MLNLKVWAWSLACWTTVSYLLCVVWGLVAPGALHSGRLLEAVLPGFRWLTVGGFFIGLIESIVCGAFAGLLFVPVHNFFWRRWGAASSAPRTR